MFHAEPKLVSRLVPHLLRVVVFDPVAGSSQIATDLLKSVGARQTTAATRTQKGMELIAYVNPQLLVVEAQCADFNGINLVRQLRRSTLACRQAPVIVTTVEATVELIKAARDAGAHEILRKPFTAAELFRRVENVCLKPRPWIEAKMYVGPDRRRFNSGEFEGSRKRRSDEPPASASLAAADLMAVID